ncbi:MAG: alpha-galactosidase, partial [Candidatus Heimdallarchaeota archaeon]|nr:alpha-galactosidase [Candidatus Heimdallarchaeota archaeon]
YSFDYVFAITMMAQPLAWFEGSGLPNEAASVSSDIEKYSEVQHDLHSGYIFPIGDEPSGRSWTGFQSVKKQEGYILVFRENSELSKKQIKTYIQANHKVEFIVLLGEGKDFTFVTNSSCEIEFEMNSKNSYALYKYQIRE